MPHVAFVPLVGFRFREPQMAELGMSLPALRRRAKAVGELPALGLLTLAGATPEPWTCSYQSLAGEEGLDELVAQVMDSRPTLVALSALTASAPLAYRLAERFRAAGVRTVIGGLHATVCPDEAARHCDAVVLGSGELVWPQVLRDAESGELQPTYDARRLPAEAWPLPRFDLLGPQVPRYTLQTQRGCPLACEFCGASRLLGPFREKPLDRHARFSIGGLGARFISREVQSRTREDGAILPIPNRPATGTHARVAGNAARRAAARARTSR